jgi:hypothetical protein
MAVVRVANIPAKIESRFVKSTSLVCYCYIFVHYILYNYLFRHAVTDKIMVFIRKVIIKGTFTVFAVAVVQVCVFNQRFLQCTVAHFI